MPDIRQLPPSVINKIAAGEVIERPASVVKELLENALDAGSTRVDITIEAGGSELVRIVDNGCGIAADQLPLALASHATSKIRDADDLFHVRTLGFRGEALASIAEVSQLRLRSRQPGDDAGAEIEVVGGKLGPITPCGAPVGTLIEVRNLFYNTPVRRKFLRTSSTELAHCAEAFTRLALGYPQVHLTLRHGEKVVHDLPPCADVKDRIGLLLGRELAEGLIAVESVDGPLRLSGYVARPEHSRAHNRMQYLFLNGRHIRDKALGHALGEAYRGLLLTGRFPITFLRLEMPPDWVDVNVHPTKLEVRFQDSGRLYSQLLGTLRTRFLTTDLTTTVGRDRAGGAGGPAESSPGTASAVQAQRIREDLVAWAKGELAQSSLQFRPTAGVVPPEPPELDFTPPAKAPLELAPFAARVAPGSSAPAATSEFAGQRTDAAAGGPGSAHYSPVSAAPRAPTMVAGGGMQVHNKYLVAETDEGMVVIDQHALHERILYEQLRDRVAAGQLEQQRLLVPEPVTLAPSEAAAVIEAKELLAELGIGVEPFGGDTILVSSYPAMLANFSPSEVLRAAIEPLVAHGRPDTRALLDELLHMVACKAAIKAGDRLQPDEITALLAQRHLVQDAHHCPHGRPTALVFTREELDRRFKRI